VRKEESKSVEIKNIDHIPAQRHTSRLSLGATDDADDANFMRPSTGPKRIMGLATCHQLREDG
jgi:hypothetical protein